jgi:hypothetical protein
VQANFLFLFVVCGVNIYTVTYFKGTCELKAAPQCNSRSMESPVYINFKQQIEIKRKRKGKKKKRYAKRQLKE